MTVLLARKIHEWAEIDTNNFIVKKSGHPWILWATLFKAKLQPHLLTMLFFLITP